MSDKVSGKELRLAIKKTGIKLEEAMKIIGINRTTFYQNFRVAEVDEKYLQKVREKLNISLGHSKREVPDATDYHAAYTRQLEITQDILIKQISKQEELIQKVEERLNDVYKSLSTIYAQNEASRKTILEKLAKSPKDLEDLNKTFRTIYYTVEKRIGKTGISPEEDI